MQLLASVVVHVDAGKLASVRRAIVLACGERLQIMSIGRLKGSGRMRVFAGMHLEAFESAVEAIMRVVPDCELRGPYPAS